MDDGVGGLLAGFAEGFGKAEVGEQGAVDLAIVGEVDLEGVDLFAEGWWERVEVEV